MDFDLGNVRTTVDIESGNVIIGDYGYFSNDLESLKRAVNKRQSLLHVLYTKLVAVNDDKFERRFSTDYGDFSLFYPLDKVINKERY